MSLRAITWAWEQDVDDRQLLVLLAMANWADEEDLTYPSVAQLVVKSRKSRRTVQRILRELEAMPLVQAVERGGIYGDERKATLYRLLIDPRHGDAGVTVTPVPPVAPHTSLVEEVKNQQETVGASPVTPVPDPDDDVGFVWAHYVSIMQPRNTVLDAEGRRLLREALKVADRAALCRAIDGCFVSDFHMKRGQYLTRPGPRHNALSKIVKGKRGGRTTREQIDFFMDLAERSGVGAGIASVDPGIVQQRKLHVRTGLAPGAAEHLQQRGKEAEDWLAQHGIRTVHEAGVPGGVRFEADTGGTT